MSEERLELKLRVIRLCYTYEAAPKRLGRSQVKRLVGYVVLDRNGKGITLPMGPDSDVAYDGEFFYVPREMAEKLNLA